jgi:hypothetical protein
MQFSPPPITSSLFNRNIRVVQVKHRQGSRNVYNIYLTNQATGTDHHCLGTCPNTAQVSLYPPQRTWVAGWTTVPLPHKPPHRNWTACPSESSSMAQTHDSHTGVIQNTPAKTAQGAPCCMGSMWACVIVEHKYTLGQFSSYPGSTTGIVAACVYVSLEQHLQFHQHPVLKHVQSMFLR